MPILKASPGRNRGKGKPTYMAPWRKTFTCGLWFFQGIKKTAEEEQTEKTNVEFFSPRRPLEPILQCTRAATLSLSGDVIQFLHWQTLAQTGPEEKIDSLSLSPTLCHPSGPCNT